MWALVVGVAGLVVVAAAGCAAVRRSRRADEREFLVGHTVSFSLAFLILVGPGVAAVLGAIEDPFFGRRQRVALVTALVGGWGAQVAVAAGVAAVWWNAVPARRRFLVRLHAYVALSFLGIFALPGLLAYFGAIPDPMPGLVVAADLLFFFFLLPWARRKLERYRKSKSRRYSR